MIITVREKTIDEKAAAIEAKYQPQLDMYSNLVLTAISSDGTNQTTKVTSLQAKYKEINDMKNAELEALYV